MREDYTDMTVLLDRSGSMASIQKDMQGGFDSLIADQKKLPGELRVTLYQFDSLYEKVYEAKAVADVPKLSLQPRGSTALLDAFGRAITETGERLAALPEASRPGKVLFVVITDGYENASKEFTREAVKKLVTQQSLEYQWQFTYLGANVDSFGEAASLGIPTAAAMNYAPTAHGANAMYSAASANLTKLRSGATRSMSYSAEQREESMK